jgi:hypothetical protein
MKKLLLLSVVAAVAIAGCKKKDAMVSDLRNYSTPTIQITSGTYYSMPVGGIVPVMTGTAYDSFYNEDATVLFDRSKLDVTEPGLYPVEASASNKYGMKSTTTLWVAVTNVDPTINLAGMYYRAASNDTVMLSRLANGLYYTTDAAANGAGDTITNFPAYFVQTSAVELVFPAQQTKLGLVSGTEGTVTMSLSDTTYEYKLINNALAPTTRLFKKL